MKRITLVTALAVAVAACATVPAFGSGAATISSHVYSTRIAGASPPVLNGTWRLTVNQKTFAVTKGVAAAVSGTVRIAGSRITFHDLAGPFACRGTQATGTYAWRIAGKRLTLTAVREPCAGRKTILTRPFTRVL
jgi:hypothetical protein